MGFGPVLNRLFVALVLCYGASGSSTASGSKSPAAPQVSHCAANCTLTYYEFGRVYWGSIELSTTYTHTVILVVDEENHTTRTSTKLVAIPPSVDTHHLMPTNSAGTVVAKLGDGAMLTYPTNTIYYPDGVRATGTYNTSSRCVTLPGTIIWPSSALLSLTQDAPTFPAGETDHFGIMYTVWQGGTSYPSAFLEAQKTAGVIPTQCFPNAVAPVAAVQGVLVLTSTSISTLQNTKTTEQASRTTANPIKQTATSASISTLQNTKTTEQASRTTAKPIKKTTTSNLVAPTQSNPVTPSPNVSSPTTTMPTLPMSLIEPTFTTPQPKNLVTTPQQSLSRSIDTTVQIKSSIAPENAITAPTSPLQSSKPSTWVPTLVKTSQVLPTGNAIAAVENPHSGFSVPTIVSSSFAPLASIVRSTSDKVSAISYSSTIVSITPPSLSSPTIVSSTGLGVGAYIMSVLGSLTASTSTSTTSSSVMSSTTSSLASTSVSSSISFSLSSSTSTSISSPSPAQISTSAGRRIGLRMESLIVAFGVMLMFGF